MTLRAVDETRTEVTLVVEGPWLIGLRRAFPRQALERLHSLLRTASFREVRPLSLLAWNPVSARAPKYVFVTGGVVSALGKGIVAASLGRLLKARGLRVQLQKFDPYLNVDPGTMSPFQHGEVFVTEDGAETDLDIGHYERFVDENFLGSASHSAGAIWQTVLRKERKGDFLGATVQVIPHITNEIKARIRRGAEAAPDRRRHLRDRRHGRRHRVAPVPRGDAPVPARGRRRERHVHPRHARPVHRGGRRAEDEADAALGERAAPHRYPPGRDRLPLARGALARHPRQDRALRRRRSRRR